MFRKWKTTICGKIHMLLEVGFASVFFSEDVFLEQTHWLFKTYVFYCTCVFEAVLYASVHSSRASIIACNYANLQGIAQDCARLRNTAVRKITDVPPPLDMQPPAVALLPTPEHSYTSSPTPPFDTQSLAVALLLCLGLVQSLRACHTGNCFAD